MKKLLLLAVTLAFTSCYAQVPPDTNGGGFVSNFLTESGTSTVVCPPEFSGDMPSYVLGVTCAHYERTTSQFINEVDLHIKNGVQVSSWENRGMGEVRSSFEFADGDFLLISFTENLLLERIGLALFVLVREP